MVRLGHARASKEPGDYRMKYTNEDILKICRRNDVLDFVQGLQSAYLGHVTRYDDTSIVKQLVYNADKYGRCGQPPATLESQVLKQTNQTREQFYETARLRLKNRSDGKAELPSLQIR